MGLINAYYRCSTANAVVRNISLFAYPYKTTKNHFLYLREIYLLKEISDEKDNIYTDNGNKF